MSNELLMANFVMLAMAVIAGAGYAYFFRGTSPYAPSVLDYLSDRATFKGPTESKGSTAAAESRTGRAA